MKHRKLQKLDEYFIRARAEPDGTRAETTFRLSPKRTSPFKSAGESVQSTAGGRGVRISFNNAGYTTFRGRLRVLATHSICQFPLHFPTRASPSATTFRTQYSSNIRYCRSQWPRSLRRGSAAARLLRLRVRTPPGVSMCLSLVNVVCCHVEVSGTS